jgi:hypothetical protein
MGVLIPPGETYSVCWPMQQQLRLIIKILLVLKKIIRFMGPHIIHLKRSQKAAPFFFLIRGVLARRRLEVVVSLALVKQQQE